MKMTSNSMTVHQLNEVVKTRFELLQVPTMEDMILKTMDAQEKGLVKQRPQKPHIVNKYKKDMQNGDWGANPQPVVITKDGYIIDGMHRLMAAVDAKLPMVFNVTRHWPSGETFKILDIGTPRSIQQIFAMEGLSYGTKRVAIARGLILLAHEGKIGILKSAFSAAEIQRVLDLVEKSFNAVAEICVEHSAFNKNTGEFLATLVWYHTVNSDKAIRFAESFFKMDFEKGSAVWGLKRWFDNQGSMRKYKTTQIANVTSAAIERWDNNAKVEHIRASPEATEKLCKANEKLANSIRAIVKEN